jgi:hypothetical protein
MDQQTLTVKAGLRVGKPDMVDRRMMSNGSAAVCKDCEMAGICKDCEMAGRWRRWAGSGLAALDSATK